MLINSFFKFKEKFDIDNNAISFNSAVKWVTENVDTDYPRDEIQRILMQNKELINKRFSTFAPVFNSFIKSIKTNPTNLLNNVYRNQEVTILRNCIQTKNNCLYHFVKDKNDYIRYLIGDCKLNFSPPSKF